MAKRSYLLHSPTQPGPLAGLTLVLWHGAGGDVDHSTIVITARRFAAEGGHAVRARFPYRVEGRRAPDRMPKLMDSARGLLTRLMSTAPLAGTRLVLGGRSMGGRMTSMLAAEGFVGPVAGLVLMSYPLHPADKPDQLRDAHLADVSCPMLFLQGAKDNMARLDLLRPVIRRLGHRAALEVFERGDHSMSRVDARDVAEAALRWARGL